ncbi:peptidoglycan-associated lipoprotein Pal [Catenovulum maritimum]|jgi:peptidoglycan-associated lipoprotein|uniref:Peptidoglycan-associated lipoprotein n=1 Tax=Catenovulum maritimum TaxID=1513271 RepID=A0A0J8GXI8_9ALTE|nr:peptidoglycan-associated lipoprotein Pal [Catenovulum maritimum]KMT65463.1 lipoprotein [Catenovulum maritimum]
MQPTKIAKCLMIVLPLFTAACSTTTGEDESIATNAADTATTSGGVASNGTANGGVEVSTLEQKRQIEIEQEKMKQKALLKTSTIFFDFDESNIQGKYFEVLQAHATYLTKNPSVKVVIEGHCDERGTPEYNIALGERRAKSVAKHLQNHGVLASQISTVSYGEEKALDKSRTEAGFAKNRRAVLVY